MVAHRASAAAVDASSLAANGNERGAAACASCHGSYGEGTPAAGFPRLAGLNSEYLVRQLESFASGSRKSEIMAPIAQALDKDERDAVASYYARMDSKQPSDDGDASNVAGGAALSDFGDWPKGVPGCVQCHGPSGEGVGGSFPALAGQSAEYISNQLAAWRNGERNNDPMHLMSDIAKNLTDKEIASVAAYFSRLAPARHAEGEQ